MAATGAGLALVVWGDIFRAAFRASGFHHTPDDLRTESTPSNPLALIDGAEYGAVVTPSAVNQSFTAILPGRNRRRFDGMLARLRV
jgi:hypothetical protein